MSGWSGLFPQWLGGSAGLINQAIPAGTDLGAALGAMNPGMTGMAAMPNEAFNATQPFDVSGINAPGSGVSSKGLVDALGQAGKSAGAGQQGAAASKAGGVQLGQAPLGQPRAAVNLDNLVKLLAQRREALMPGSATSGQPPGAQHTVGLLGF